MRSIDPFCAVWAGLVAGVLASVVQVVLWLVFTDAWPGILWRDSRLAAAVVLGSGVLAPADEFDATVVAVATIVHFALSVAYGFVVAWLVGRSALAASLLIGGAFGVALFFVNMVGFTLIFPWFAAARDGITLAAHIAFGVIAAAAYRRCA